MLPIRPIFVVFLLGLPSSAAEPISYNRDIRPILSENCFFCHGFDEKKREGDLRLDTFDGAIEDKGGYAAIVPGKPDASELISRIFSDDRTEKMPPPKSAYRLTAAQKDKLRRWIAEGAKYEGHWAYAPIRRTVGAQTIDGFLSSAWSRSKIAPAPVAAARAVLRRLSFDLTGLPPALEDVAAFERDPSEVHYAQFAERYIASRAFGEHMAARWLDLVRYADSSGIASDEPIDTQAYRAYVIRAFWENKPFDQFTREQLAGDLLASPSDDSLVASAYNRLVRTNSEAGVIPEEAAYAMKGDHVRAVSTVWLGSTVGCAECHDHKYDPFTQRDYYRLAAFFDDLIETGVYSPGDRRAPLHWIHPNPETKSRATALESRLVELNRRLIEDNPALDAVQAAWEQMQGTVLETAGDLQDWLWMPAHLPAAHVQEGIAGECVVVHAGKSARVQTAPAASIARHMAAEVITGFLKDDFRKTGGHYFTEVFFDAENPPTAFALQVVDGGYGRLGWRPDIFSTYVWGEADAFKNEPWVHAARTRHMGPLPAAGDWARLEVPAKDSFAMIDGQYQHTGLAWAQKGGCAWIADSGLSVPTGHAARLRLAASAFRAHENLPVHRDIHTNRAGHMAALVRKLPAKRTPSEAALVRRAFRESAQPDLVAEIATAERELFALRRRAVPSLVSRAGVPKTTRVLARGDFRDESGEIVAPGIPAFFGSIDTGGRRATRRDLADWIVSPENPLTARVFVNRLWSQFFGRGINDSIDENGSQGQWPTHPELLDWLASEFIQSGWNVHHIVRLIVTSNAYRLTSQPSPEQLEADPLNTLHAYQARFRLPAESVRDAALAVSGLLVHDGDPTRHLFPYQPPTYWDQTNKVMLGSRFLDYRASEGTQQYRRSIYTFWKRIGTHPTLLAFDAPSRHLCQGRRTSTNTPAQALVLLNDPIFVEAARALATNILQGHHKDIQARIADAATRVLARVPSAAEAALLQDFVEKQRAHFRAYPREATALLAVGQASVARDVDPVELAAWTALCRVLLNLHESITRS
jgi:hypothetical protein